MANAKIVQSKNKTPKASRVPENETKSERFIRLAKPRTTRLLNDIRSLGKLSVRSNYDYTEEQIEAIKRAVSAEVAAMFARFEDTKPSKSADFDF